MTGVTFPGLTTTYTGTPHSLAVSSLPTGVTSVTYLDNDKTNAGSYTVTAKFAVDPNYNQVPDLTAMLVIQKADPSVTPPTLTYIQGQKLSSQSPNGNSDVPGAWEWIDDIQLTTLGSQSVTAKFTPSNSNYNPVESTFAVTVQPPPLEQFTVTYQSGQGFTLTGPLTIESGKTLVFTIELLPSYNKSHFTVTAGDYEVLQIGETFEIENVTNNLIITVTGVTLNTYTVTFKNPDGTVLETQTIEHGTPASPTPPRGGSHAFLGWDKPYDNITEDLEVTAIYSPTLNTYTVEFRSWDGQLLDTQEITHGESATAPPAPKRPGHKFIEWDKRFNEVTGELTITAIYSQNNTINAQTVLILCGGVLALAGLTLTLIGVRGGRGVKR